ncbi:hypothetical protein [Aquimarina rhabdastrellae]
MKTLSEFKANKLDLKTCEKIKGGWHSYILEYAKPGGTSTPGNWVVASYYDEKGDPEIIKF